jgi:hypothetical protein
MTTLATFILFIGIVVVFILGVITGAALSLLGTKNKSDHRVGVSYRPDAPVKTKIWGGNVEEETKH